MTLTLPELTDIFEKRIAAKSWTVPDGAMGGEIRRLVDYIRGMMLGNFFKTKNDLEYQVEKYFEDRHQVAEVAAGLEAAGATHDFIQACVAATQEEIDETGSAKVVTVNDCANEVYTLYEKGFDTGIQLNDWVGLNSKFRIAKKQLTVLTGMGGVGKSTWLDNYLVKLAEKTGWKILFYSPENYPVAYHIEKLASIKSGHPFFVGKNERMSPQEITDAMAWINDHFFFITSDDNATLDVILNVFRREIDTRGIDVCIIDPWNTVEHKRPESQPETEYICEALTKCLGFTRRKDVGMFIVAHPRILRRDKNGDFPAPTPYDISGSANWANRPDNNLTVHREKDGSTSLIVNKIRFRMYGEVGTVPFKFERMTNTFSETTPADLVF